MKSRTFSLDDQLAFAQLSGDYNPLHVDPVLARRLMFGSPVVHGIHSLLWALDEWLRDVPQAVEFGSIKVFFQKPIRLGEPVECAVTRHAGEEIEMELRAGGSLATKVKLDWRRSEGDGDGDLVSELPQHGSPADLSADEVEKASGSLELRLDRGAAAALFAHAAERLPAMQLAQLLATTRLVGMICPGLHSVFSALDLRFHRETEGLANPSLLSYQATKLDRRFGLVSMRVRARGMTGTVKAFLRPAPRQQVSFAELKGRVARDEFAHQRALVVGGSRGLGEVTAKLLAAGGAQVRITYCQGADDARKVVEDVRRGGGSAQSQLLDVLDDRAREALSGDTWTPTHLYYFATPFIFSAERGRFSTALFLRFCEFYVIGFQRLFEQLVAGGLRAVLYPSSIAVSELPPNMCEYAAAKAAGETLCDFLERAHAGIVICRPRLPRMATDQTASIMPGGEHDPVEVILEVLRRLGKEA